MSRIGIAFLLLLIVNAPAFAEDSTTAKPDPVKPGIVRKLVKLPGKAWNFFANRLVDLYAVPVRNAGS